MTLRLILFALTLVTMGCSSPDAGATTPPPAAHPALWKAYDGDTVVYLFGTIHLLPKGMTWTTPAMARAMTASESLVLEVVLDKDPAKLGAVMQSLALSPNLPPILDRVPPDKRAALSVAIGKAGLTTAYADKLETWAVALAVSTSGLAKLGVEHDEGVEPKLTQVFADAHKPVTGLETPAQQLGYFDQLPEAAQRKFLLATIGEDDRKAKVEFAAMVSAWKAGDVRRIAVTFDDEMKLSPELSDALLTRRNARWADWIAARMKAPGTIFIAVGAGHLAGKGSVEDLLAHRGVKVVRVQ